MRILIVSQYFHPENFRINDLAVALRQAGHGVTVLTAQPTYPKAGIFPGYDQRLVWSETLEGIEVVRVPIWRRKQGGRTELALNYLSFVFFAVFLGLPRVRRRGRFDVMLVWATSPVTAAIPAILYKWCTGTKIAVWVQDLWPEVVTSVGAIRSRFIVGLLGAMVDFIYRHCDMLLAQSTGFAAAIAARGVPRDKITVVPNWGIEPGRSGRTGEGAPAGEPPQARILRAASGFKILYAGNIGKAQDLETVAAAADQLRGEDVLWAFVGDGSEKRNFQAGVRASGLESRFLFLDPCGPDEINFIYKEADAHLITLRSDPVLSRTVPSKVQSCLASAKPIVAVIDGSGAEVLRQSGAAFCSEPGRPSGLSGSVRTLVGLSAEMRAKMGESGRAWYNKHYTKNAVVRLIEGLLARLAG
jgi:colanic acid biosynthesis glycosyl transferase WcaI